MKGTCLVLICKVFMSFGLLFSQTVTAQDTVPAELPTRVFSQLPAFERPQLSLSGNKVAYIRNIAGDQAASVLMVLDMDTKKNHMLLHADNEKVKFNWFRWANDETLLISSRTESRDRGLRYYETRLFGMPYNAQEKGKQAKRMLSARSYNKYGSSHVPQFQDNIVSWLPEDPDHVLISVDMEVSHVPSVYKLDVNKARMSRLEKSKRKIRDWFADRQGVPRVGIALNFDNGKETVYYKNGDEWDVLFTFNAMEDKGVTIKGFAKDPNQLYYTAYKGDYKVLYKMDLTTKESVEILAEEGYDVTGSLIYSPVTNDAIGIYHPQADNGRHYWEDRYGKLQKGLDQALPDYNNYLISFSKDENNYILFSEKDDEPGTYYIGDRKAGTIDLLFRQYPEIDQNRIGEHKLVSYEARDGTKIHGYLTLPKVGKAPYPTIIHPHGGPGARDYAGFDYLTAYLSNKGYAVFRPNFRGSSGYGYQFAQAQMAGWGLEMQDDITDGTQWLIDEGITDKEKMCIVGWSYGGYAALMATVKTPQLYKCAVSMAGVSDLDMLVKKSRYFLNKKFVKNQIGEDSDDREARSPITHVEKIQTPILLVHGDEDRSVHVDHSRDMADELEDHDKVFKYVELDAGDHYLSIQRNRHIFFNEMDTFLEKYLQ